jgi:hypothetical protein
LVTVPLLCQHLLPVVLQNRVFIIEDATTRTTSNFTIGVLTTGQASATPVPVGSTLLLVSDGANTLTSIGIMSKGYNSISDTNSPYLLLLQVIK